MLVFYGKKSQQKIGKKISLVGFQNLMGSHGKLALVSWYMDESEKYGMYAFYNNVNLKCFSKQNW